MKRFITLVSVRSKEFYRDRSTLIWTFLFPFVVLLGFAYGYSGKGEPLIKIGYSASQPQIFENLKPLKAINTIQFVEYSDDTLAFKRLERHQLDAYLKLEDEQNSAKKLTYWINPLSQKALLTEHLIKTGMPTPMSSDSNRYQLLRKELEGKKLRYADWLVPGLLSMNLMFSSLFGIGYVVVRYRKNGVLKRLRATPLSAIEFLLAQIASRMILLLITSTLTLLGARILIGFHPQGSLIHFLSFIAVGSMSLMSLGLLVASRISSEEVADGILNLMTWPMIFLSGIWFSLDGASPWVIRISQLIPLTHIVDGARKILIEGDAIQTLAPQMVVLSAVGIVFLILGSLLFRWR